MYSLTSKLLFFLTLCAFSTLPAGAAEVDAAVLKGVDVSLKDRATAYWTARASRSGDVMRFYAPVEKGGPKRSRDVSEFGNVGFKAFEIKKARENGEFGLVTIEVQTDLRGLPLPQKFRTQLATQTIDEEWLRIDDVWYKKPIPRGFSSKKAAEAAAPAETQADAAAEAPTSQAD